MLSESATPVGLLGDRAKSPLREKLNGLSGRDSWHGSWTTTNGGNGRKMDIKSLLHRIATEDQGHYAERVFKRLPKNLDNQDEVQLETLLHLADCLLTRIDEMDELDTIEELIESQPEKWPLAARMIVKLARSKAVLDHRTGRIHFSVVVPLYGEHERLLHPFEHPSGEDLIRQKFATGKTIEILTGHITWAMMLRRESLSVLHRVYSFAREYRNTFCRIPPKVLHELFQVKSKILLG